MPGIRERIAAAYKAFTFPGIAGWLTPSGRPVGESLYYPGTSRDYWHEAGELTESSAVMACVRWITRVWPEAPPAVYRTDAEGQKVPVPNHPLIDLLSLPNPDYGAGALWMGTLLSLNLDGNAYWFILRNALGMPIGLYYLPHFKVEPKWDNAGQKFITHYDYNPMGQIQRLRIEDVVHFRDGIDPHNIRKGLSPLKSVIREIYTDNEAANYSASLVKNSGVPGVLISPAASNLKDGARIAFDQATAEALKATWKRNTTGDKRGEPLVTSIPAQVSTFAFSPEQMVLRDLRQIPEERISAIIGIPAVVVGLGAGLDRSTYNNVSEAREQAYESNIIPTQSLVGAELTTRLLPEFSTDRGLSVGFDNSRVRVLQEDQDKLAERISLLFKNQIIRRSEAREAMGFKADAEDEVFLAETASTSIGPGLDEEGRPMEEEGAEPGQGRSVSSSNGRRNGRRQERGLRYVDGNGNWGWVPVKGLAESVEKETKARQKRSLQETVERFRAGLLAREERVVADMTKYLEEAEVMILKKANDLGKRIKEAHDEGVEVTEHWLTQQRRYFELTAQIEMEMRMLGARVSDRLSTEQQEQVDLALEQQKTLTGLAAGEQPAGVRVAWNRLNKAAIENLVGYAADGSPLRELFAAIGPDAVENATKALVNGLAAGMNPRDTARVLKESLGISKARALNIARTETLRAYREASRQSYLQNENSVTGWRWFAATDTRTCPGCWAMHGSAHSAEEHLDGHPSCRCVMIPVTKSWAEILGDDSIPDTRPEIETGEAMFARLSEEEQKQILGEGAFALYRDGKTTLADHVRQTSDPRWGTMRREATQQEALAHAASR